MLFKEDAVARAEVKAVRENAGWYRWTHDLVQVTGPDAEAFLDWMLVNTIAGLPVGRGKYTTMLDEKGEIIDDLVCMHKAEGLWWLSTLYAPRCAPGSPPTKANSTWLGKTSPPKSTCTPCRVPPPLV